MKTLRRRAANAWESKDFRYMCVAICSGLLNLSVFTTLVYICSLDHIVAKFIAVPLGAAFGYWGHEFVSYGRDQSKDYWRKRVGKFTMGLIANGLLFTVTSFGFEQIESMPYYLAHFLSMCIGFVFFMFWNRMFTFNDEDAQEKPTSELSDSLAVART